MCVQNAFSTIFKIFNMHKHWPWLTFWGKQTSERKKEHA